ncbi:diacylglycerol kinase family protein [Streptomyces sp. DH12]|uniref:diacylglycerol/lipid kinase family protein n=1 Tax=Streptomyces sp. DH12 TaxID=2857010 RepID=UPI001E52F7B9|nr:diacylglycerol kinase family protein [Streptomyces sp. DH12]
MSVGWDAYGRAGRAQRWSARLALAAAASAVLLPLLQGGLGGILLLLCAAAATAVGAAAVWWTLTTRGPVRAGAAALAVAAPLAVVGLFAAAGMLRTVVVCLALWSLAVWAGRYALRSTGLRPPRVREHRTPPPRRPVVFMNPRSGGGKVERLGLQAVAERLGARVVLLDRERHHDVAASAREAVTQGADLLGVAGGDGTQALVAGVAAEHGVPLLVVPAGTRNHFAMDLGLDRDDPAAALDALRDGVELRVDLGFAGERPFVNNVSFGVYAAVVQSPAYRDDKVGTLLGMLPDLLAGQGGQRLTARAGDTLLTDPQALLVSNNPYRRDDPFGLGRRERLDSGTLGVLGVRVDGPVAAAGLLLDPQANGITVTTAREVVVRAGSQEPTAGEGPAPGAAPGDGPVAGAASSIEVGIDGEALVLPSPVRCRTAPGVLRVRVPRHRPGVPEARPPLDWRRLRKLAAAVGRTAVTGRPDSASRR